MKSASQFKNWFFSDLRLIGIAYKPCLLNSEFKLITCLLLLDHGLFINSPYMDSAPNWSGHGFMRQPIGSNRSRRRAMCCSLPDALLAFASNLVERYCTRSPRRFGSQLSKAGRPEDNICSMVLIARLHVNQKCFTRLRSSRTQRLNERYIQRSRVRSVDLVRLVPGALLNLPNTRLSRLSSGE